jgi:ribosomal protein S18 acetylase RimI-like enzyme
MVAMGTAEIRLLKPEEWRTFRDLRLRALTDAPNAFGSTLAYERALTDAQWRQRLARRAQFVASIDGTPAATAAAIRARDGATAELVSMWVDPSCRGRGLGDLLVREVVAWATLQGLAEVRLWVTEGNRRAERLYLRHGFTPTGERQPVLPEDATRFEFGMVRRLQSRPDS